MNVPNTYSLCTFIVFSGYLLTTDTEKRPDIYQCSYLAFKLNDSTEKCPVQNLNKAKKPSFDDISLGKTFWKKIKLKPIKNVYFLPYVVLKIHGKNSQNMSTLHTCIIHINAILYNLLIKSI